MFADALCTVAALAAITLAWSACALITFNALASPEPGLGGGASSIFDHSLRNRLLPRRAEMIPEISANGQ